jgi:hypothetical protein
MNAKQSIKWRIAIISALVFLCVLSSVGQPFDKKHMAIAYCVSPKTGVTDSDKVELTNMLQKHVQSLGIPFHKFRMMIEFMPNSESKERLDLAKLAIQEVSQLATGLGIKRLKRVYLGYNPEVYSTGDCVGIEIVIFLD